MCSMMCSACSSVAFYMRSIHSSFLYVNTISTYLRKKQKTKMIILTTKFDVKPAKDVTSLKPLIRLKELKMLLIY